MTEDLDIPRGTPGKPDETVEKDSQTPGPRLLQKCAAEAFGTGCIVIFGVGSVNSAVLTGAQSGIWQVAVVWFIGVLIAIVTTAAISGAHLNPAVSFAFAVRRPKLFPLKHLLPYCLAQVLGAFFASFINYFLFFGPLDRFEQLRDIERGDEASVLSAMVFGEYFPNPAFEFQGTTVQENEVELVVGALGWSASTVQLFTSLCVEAFGTFILLIVIFSVTDSRNSAVKNKDLAPFLIALTVSGLISLYASLNQAGFNPARDFGPRLASVCLGYGSVAFPGPRNGFWVYILGPLFGGPLGALFYDYVLRLPSREKKD